MLVRRSLIASAILAVGLSALPAQALLLSGPDIIAAPSFVTDDAPGAENTHQQAFNEAQGVVLGFDLAVDGGFIAAGTVVDSHMIFLNTPDNELFTDTQTWTFYGDILGVMSDKFGALEEASNSFLGAAGTVYTSAFKFRGLENRDSYSVLGNLLTLTMRVSEPGDWIRVITVSHPVPEPSTLLLLGSGLVGLAGYRRRRKSA